MANDKPRDEAGVAGDIGSKIFQAPRSTRVDDWDLFLLNWTQLDTLRGVPVLLQWELNIRAVKQNAFVTFDSGDRDEQEIVLRRWLKVLLQTPPQNGKSLSVIDFIAWAIGHDPELRVIYSSFSDRLGIRANLRLQRPLDSPDYHKIFPETRLSSKHVMTIAGRPNRMG